MVMNVGFLSRIPWLPLMLLWLAYALLGWYLSAHHIVWLVGAFVAAFALAFASKGSPLLDRLVRFGSQGLVAVLIISLIVSTSFVLAAIWSILFALIVIPLGTTFLAEVEMRFAGFSKLVSVHLANSCKASSQIACCICLNETCRQFSV